MQESARLFPRQRVQRLLDNRKYPGIVPRVRVEGVFIQLGESGLPERQVFLAITPAELVIVKQEVPLKPEVGPEVMPTDIRDLEVDHVIPLAVLKFFILDDRARRFTVCTCLDKVFYFEMCQLELDTDFCWLRWRSVTIDLGGIHSNTFGFNTWNSPYVVNIKNNLHNKFDLARNMFGKPKLKAKYYIHHPHTFYQVKSRGVQTNDLGLEPSDKSKSDIKIPGDDSLASVNSNISAGSLYGHLIKETMEKNRSKLFTAKLKAEHENEKQIRELLRNGPLVESTSSIKSILDKRLTVLSAGNHCVGNRDHVLHSTTELLSRSRSWCELDSATINASLDQFSLAGSVKERCAFARKLLRQSSTPRRKRNKKKTSLIRMLDLDSDYELDPGNRKPSSDTRSAKYLWMVARTLTLKSCNIRPAERRLQEIVSYLVFNSHIERPHYVHRITDFHPSDVSRTLASLSRKIVLSVTMADVQNYTSSAGKQIADCIKVIGSYEHELSKLVVFELLKSYHHDYVPVLEFFIQTCACLLFTHRDLQSLIAILRGLTSLPVYRLNYMWTAFAVSNPLTFRRLIAMLPIASASSSSYNKRLSYYMTTNLPFIPWPENILSHCRDRKQVCAYKTMSNAQERAVSKATTLKPKISNFVLKLANAKKRIDAEANEDDTSQDPNSKSILRSKRKSFLKTVTSFRKKSRKKRSVSFKKGQGQENVETSTGNQNTGTVKKDEKTDDNDPQNLQSDVLEENLQTNAHTSDTEADCTYAEHKEKTSGRKKEKRRGSKGDAGNEDGCNGNKSEKKKKSVFNTMRQKMKSEREIITEHINVVQQDIAEIEELIEDVRISAEQGKAAYEQKTAEEEKRREARKQTKLRKAAKLEEEQKRKKILISLYGPLEKEEMEDIIEGEQVPYKPRTSKSLKQISVLEDAIDEHVCELEEDEDFETLKRTQMARNGSPALGLLEDVSSSESETGEQGNLRPTESKTSKGSSIVKSMTRFFEEKLENNNNNSALGIGKPSTPIPPKISKECDSSLTTELSLTHCDFCGKGPCLYIGKNFCQAFCDQQQMASRVDVKSRQNVKSYLKGLFWEYESVTDFDLFQFSQSCE